MVGENDREMAEAISYFKKVHGMRRQADLAEVCGVQSSSFTEMKKKGRFLAKWLKKVEVQLPEFDRAKFVKEVPIFDQEKSRETPEEKMKRYKFFEKPNDLSRFAEVDPSTAAFVDDIAVTKSYLRRNKIDPDKAYLFHNIFPFSTDADLREDDLLVVEKVEDFAQDGYYVVLDGYKFKAKYVELVEGSGTDTAYTYKISDISGEMTWTPEQFTEYVYAKVKCRFTQVSKS